MKIKDVFPGCTVFNGDEFLYVVTSYPRLASERDMQLPGYDPLEVGAAFFDVTYSTGLRSTRVFPGGMNFYFPENIRIEKPDDPYIGELYVDPISWEEE